MKSPPFKNPAGRFGGGTLVLLKDPHGRPRPAPPEPGTGKPRWVWLLRRGQCRQLACRDWRDAESEAKKQLAAWDAERVAAERVKECVIWYESDTMQTVGRVVQEFQRLHVAREAPPSDVRWAGLPPGDPLRFSGHEADIYCDEIGVGKGVGDRLREQQYPCKSFMGSRRPTNEANALLYSNLRAEAYARLRTKLIRGEVGLPYSPELEEELRTCAGGLNSSGKLQIIAKKDWREILGRSPDRLDAVCMAVAGRGYASFGCPDGRTVSF